MNETLKMLLDYGIVFIIGGAFCAIAQLLIIKTKLTPARILVIFLIAGIILEGVGLFKYIVNFAGAGAKVPIIGFGAALAKGAIEYAKIYGIMGAFAGGLIVTAYGIGIAIVTSYIVTLIFNPKTKK